MRALALRTPAWEMRWLIFSCSVLRVTLSGSGGFWRGGMVVSLAGGSGAGVLVTIWRRLKSLPWVTWAAWTSPPVSPASRRLVMPVARRMAAWSMRWLISSCSALRVRGSPWPVRPGSTIGAGSAGDAGASEAAAGALVMPGPSWGGPIE